MVQVTLIYGIQDVIKNINHYLIEIHFIRYFVQLDDLEWHFLLHRIPANLQEHLLFEQPFLQLQLLLHKFLEDGR